jgi:ATP-dependent helicase HepA
MASGEAAAIFASFATDTTRVLITDSVGEEGFNLQFARAVLFYDLPWSPMRLEQRLGRLDRIDRGARITCIPVATAEDDSLALDEAWRRIVSEGLGLYAVSISDLQHLVDRMMPRLRDRAFVGGPAALVEELAAVADTVSQERAAIEEQDVIDGVHGLSSDCPRQTDLVAADKAADRLGATLTNYLKENIGIKQWWDEEDNSFTFRLPHDGQPLVPVDRLRCIATLFNAPFTVHRSVAIEDFSLQFLRPGHPAVDGCRELLGWDDRGRAFAMWRQTSGLRSVRVIFRCIVHAGTDLRAVEAWLEKSAWDEIRRGALLRMVRGWFAEFLAEIFLDEKGEPAPAAMIETCRRPYSKVDVNLGKERAEYIRSAFGAKTWQEMSQSAGQRAIEVVQSGEMLAKTREAGQSLAAEHFAMMRTRLAARAHAGIENATAVKAAEAEEKVAHSLVEQMLAQPTLRMDAIGAYFLSEKPFWEEKE